MEKHSIVWVDDDHDDLEVFGRAVNEVDSSAHTIILHNGRELLDYLQYLHNSSKPFPCLIILDMNMPLLSGREALILLKSTPEFKDIPVVVFTTSSSILDKTFCKKYDTPMFTKPNSFEELKETLSTILQTCPH